MRKKIGVLIFCVILLFSGCGQNASESVKNKTDEPVQSESTEQGTESVSEPVTESQPESTEEPEPTEEPESTEESEPTEESRPVLTAEYELIYEGINVFSPGTTGSYFK